MKLLKRVLYLINNIKLIIIGDIKGTIVLSRDHHDVGGTDSPFRETSAIKDGSKYKILIN
jgi:urocanate hydratase